MNPYSNSFRALVANARHRHYGGDLAEYRPDDYEPGKTDADKTDEPCHEADTGEVAGGLGDFETVQTTNKPIETLAADDEQHCKISHSSLAMPIRRLPLGTV